MARRALEVEAWRGLSAIRHGFYGRLGGRSRGAFAELDLSFEVGDAKECVEENWRIVREDLAPLEPVLPRQVHGFEVVEVEGPFSERPPCDALFTRRPGLALGVLTADCLPVLLVAPPSRAVAVVHAGWRGTAGDIVGRTVARMGVPPDSLFAALGPAIGGCCYEVGPEVVRALRSTYGTGVPGISRRAERTFVELRTVNRYALLRAGVRPDRIWEVGPCTRCASDLFFSHRGAGGAPTGRQLSFVAIAGRS
ncbi:MAG: laccase domain protein [Candidatus Binatia bacterium]|nr:MAG: laccase domain protein [Candidatus Binatia bacterium]